MEEMGQDILGGGAGVMLAQSFSSPVPYHQSCKPEFYFALVPQKTHQRHVPPALLSRAHHFFCPLSFIFIPSLLFHRRISISPPPVMVSPCLYTAITSFPQL